MKYLIPVVLVCSAVAAGCSGTAKRSASLREVPTSGARNASPGAETLRPEDELRQAPSQESGKHQPHSEPRTGAQESTVGTAPESVAVQEAQLTPASSGSPELEAPVAENGSRYGEISRRSGREKTVYVPPYFNAVGIRVPGHYRVAQLPVVVNAFDLGGSQYLLDVARRDGKTPAYFILGGEWDARFQVRSRARIERVAPTESASLRAIGTQLSSLPMMASSLLASTTAAPPVVAENGSVFGEVSSQTSRPKTVYVNGYFRQDGTYV